MELKGGYVEHAVELLKELLYALFAVADVHDLYSQAHNVNGGKGEIAPSYRRFFAITVFKNACAASHGCHFIFVTLRVVGTP